jgi:hypothetical protein
VFLSNSRYFSIPTLVVRTRDGREVTVVKLRRLPITPGDPTTIRPGDRLDILAKRRYGDATLYWHIADANTELEAVELERPGRAIEAPET